MNIDKELREIGRKCITGTGMELMKAFMSDLPDQDSKTPEEQPGKVKKVDIE